MRARDEQQETKDLRRSARPSRQFQHEVQKCPTVSQIHLLSPTRLVIGFCSLFKASSAMSLGLVSAATLGGQPSALGREASLQLSRQPAHLRILISSSTRQSRADSVLLSRKAAKAEVKGGRGSAFL